MPAPVAPPPEPRTSVSVTAHGFFPVDLPVLPAESDPPAESDATPPQNEAKAPAVALPIAAETGVDAATPAPGEPPTAPAPTPPAPQQKDVVAPESIARPEAPEAVSRAGDAGASEPAPDPNVRYELHQVDRPPRPLSTRLPAYRPGNARRAVEGVLDLRVLVGADGRIGSVRIASGIEDPDLRRDAVGAILHWRFTAGAIRGVEVPVWLPVRLEFSLSGSEMRGIVTLAGE